ncbi:MAG TPA: thioredoxin [Thermoanaerobaculia bacterium]|nr:thioredoxin [Thermoanaerobaculia bacterium]
MIFAEAVIVSDIVRCPSCGQANRVPELGSGKTAVCGKCKAPLTAGVIALTDSDFRQRISNGKSVVDFWAAWCGPCRMIAPLIEQLASERRDIRFAKVNVDENPQTSAQFGVHGIPLLVFFQDGVERGRVVGAVPKTQIDSAIRQYLG